MDLYIPGFHLGCGSRHFRPGYYLMGSNFDGRYGGPGPRQVADRTGIAAGYRVRQMIKHGDVNFLLTTNGTHTNIYTLSAGNWALAGAANPTFSNLVGTGMVSFKDVLAVGFNTSNAYQFSSDNGSTWTTSTKTTANAEFFKYAIVQVNGLTSPRVLYVRDPNEVYFTEDLTNGDATGSTATYIADNASDQASFNNVVEDYTGEALLCMRHDIYSIDSAGRVWRRTWDNFPDGVADAGGQADRLNFETAAKNQGRIYFNYSGNEILEWYRGNINKYMAPKHLSGNMIPRMDLPVNAMTEAAGYVVLELGTTLSGKSAFYIPGGAAHISAAVAPPTSDLYIGRYEGDQFVWHGSILNRSAVYRYMWYDEDDSYLYLAQQGSVSADLSQHRCLFYAQNPLTTLTAGIVNLTTVTWSVELGRIDFGAPFSVKEARHLSMHTMGLGATGTPTIVVLYKLTSDYVTDGFETLHTFDDNALAEIGTPFRPSVRSHFRTMHLQFNGAVGTDTYVVLYDALLTADLVAAPKRPLRRR